MPVLIPLAAAAVMLLAWGRTGFQRGFAVLCAFAHLAASAALLASVMEHGVLVVEVGSWPAPFGITLVADLLGAIMTLLGSLTGVAVIVYSIASVDAGRQAHGYFPLMHILIMGVSGSFLTGDLFNLYVWFEVMLISSFVLLALGGEKCQLEGAVKYVILNLVSSSFFLAAVGISYACFGALNMADLARRVAETESPGLATVLSMLYLTAFGIKAAVFPLFFWLPSSYHTPPIAVSAMFAGLLTKVGVYALIRVFTLIFTRDAGFTHTLILVLAGFTMVTGVLGAAAQMEIRRILSFHIISQIGYMIMGLGLYTRLALAGSVFYLIHHIVVKANLFLVGGLIHRIKGSYDLKRLGGLSRAYPGLAVLFLVPALSLAGIPPLSGFWAKLGLVRAGLDAGAYFIVILSLLVSLLTLYSMTKIWAEAFWKEERGDAVREAPPLLMVLPVLLLAILTVFIGLGCGYVFELAERAAGQLMNPQGYIDAVLGGGP
jgi:multicomponent Na+:H+ antiporter subunit D